MTKRITDRPLKPKMHAGMVPFSTENQPATPGVPRIVLDGTHLRTVVRLATLGASQISIAYACGVHDMHTFRKILERQPEVQQALDQGHAAWHDALVKRLIAQGKKSFIPNMFLLKARHGYREGDEQQGGGGPRVIINMPGAQASVDQPVGRLIEAVPMIEGTPEPSTST